MPTAPYFTPQRSCPSTSATTLPPSMPTAPFITPQRSSSCSSATPLLPSMPTAPFFTPQRSLLSTNGTTRESNDEAVLSVVNQLLSSNRNGANVIVVLFKTLIQFKTFFVSSNILTNFLKRFFAIPRNGSLPCVSTLTLICFF